MKEFINMNLIWQVCSLEVARQEWKTHTCVSLADWCKNDHSTAFCDVELNFGSHRRGHEKQNWL